MIGEPINSSDLLDAMCRAAFQPVITYTGLDYNGQPQWANSSTVASAFEQACLKALHSGEAVQARIQDELIARAPQIADALVPKMANALIVAVDQGYQKPVLRRVDKMLEGPLGAALTEALRPAVKQYVSERFPTLDLDRLQISVNVTA